MKKKINCLTLEQQMNIFTVFEGSQKINYETFRNGIINIINNNKDKIKISEDDIKTLFHVLTPDGNLTLEHLHQLKDQQNINQKMNQFYESRINKDMVKSTLFKLGKVNHKNVQLYQVKNASTLQFQQIEESIINEIPNKPNLLKKKIPHFGPLKGATKWKKVERQYNSSDTKICKRKGKHIDKERQKI